MINWLLKLLYINRLYIDYWLKDLLFQHYKMWLNKQYNEQWKIKMLFSNAQEGEWLI